MYSNSEHDKDAVDMYESDPVTKSIFTKLYSLHTYPVLLQSSSLYNTARVTNGMTMLSNDDDGYVYIVNSDVGTTSTSKYLYQLYYIICRLE